MIPKVTIRARDERQGSWVATLRGLRVEIDGVQVPGLRAVKVEMGLTDATIVTLQLLAEVDIEMQALVVVDQETADGDQPGSARD